MSAHYGHFKFDMSQTPTFTVSELKELALEASQKLPDARDFEHLFSKVQPALFNRNIYAVLLVGLAIVEYSKWVMAEIRELEPGENTGVIEAEIVFEKPKTNEEFINILIEECESLLPDFDYQRDHPSQLVPRVAARLGVEWPPKEVSDQCQ